MSQEKVDKYKQEKANRKKEIAKAKAKKKLYVISGVVVALLFVGWLVYSVFAEIQQAEDESRQQSEYESILQQMLEERATATTGSGETTTAGDGETTTAGGDETTTTSDKPSSSEEETTSAATK